MNLSDLMQYKELILCGVIAAMVVGLAFWLNSKINSQVEEIENLKKQNEILMQRAMAVEQFLRGSQPQSQPKKKKSSPTASEESEEEINVE